MPINRFVTLRPMLVKSLSPAKLGSRIKAARLKLGLSQEEVAAPDYTAAYISHIEHGKRRASQEALGHIATRLGMTVDQLISGRDPDEDMRLEVASQGAIVEIHMGKAAEALPKLEEVKRRATKVDNSQVSETVECGIGLALFKLGRIDEARGAYERALELASEGPPERWTTPLVGKARCLFHSGEVRESIHILETHLIHLRRAEHPDPGCLVETYAALIPGYFETDMIDLAMDAATKGWKLAPDIPDAAQRGCLYVNRAQLLVTQGHTREALTSLALAADLYRHLGWYAESVKVAFARSYALTEMGEWEEAERLIREALEAPGSTVNKADRIRILTRLAFIRRNCGHPKEAVELAMEAVKLSRSGFVSSAAEAEREIGLCQIELGEPESAISHWRKALAKYLKAGHKDEAAATAQLIGDRMLEEGDPAGAAAAYRQGLLGRA